MVDKKNTSRLPERFEELSKKRRELLSVSPRKALDQILSFSEPPALVHSFPEEDFYFLVHDIGDQDSLPLLKLASDRQLEYILDMEIWQKDRMEIPAFTKWLALLVQADAKRAARWFIEKKQQLTELFLNKNIDIHIREHDQDPSELGEGFFSLDNTIYIRLKDLPLPQPSPAATKDEKKQRRMLKKYREFIRGFIGILADHDHLKYMAMLQEAANLMPAETEEELYRMRNTRLAEKGFLPFEEAVGIYQSIHPRDLNRHVRRSYIREENETGDLHRTPQYPAIALKANNLFARALAEMNDGPLLNRLQGEFAGLCNRIIVADHLTVKDKALLAEVVKKACGYLHIGLNASAKGNDINAGEAAALIRKHYLSDLFRVGYGAALQLKWRAEKWYPKNWAGQQNLPLTFWGEHWTGVIGGVLLKRPLYYDNYRTGNLYREFDAMEDIVRTGKILDDIFAFDELLACLDLDCRLLKPTGRLTCFNLILTAWTHHELGLGRKLQPIPVNSFRPFFSRLFSGTEGQDQISVETKAMFLGWMMEKTRFDEEALSRKMGPTFETLFEELESEYGRVDADDLDPGLIYHFILKGA
jgi:hypothetical protein